MGTYRVKQRAANDGNENDAETTTKDLAAVAYSYTSSESAKISDHLGDSNSIGRKVKLIC